MPDTTGMDLNLHIWPWHLYEQVKVVALTWKGAAAARRAHRAALAGRGKGDGEGEAAAALEERAALAKTAGGSPRKGHHTMAADTGAAAAASKRDTWIESQDLLSVTVTVPEMPSSRQMVSLCANGLRITEPAFLECYNPALWRIEGNARTVVVGAASNASKVPPIARGTGLVQLAVQHPAHNAHHSAILKSPLSCLSPPVLAHP